MRKEDSVDLHKFVHDIQMVLNKGAHFPLFVGLLGIIRNYQIDLEGGLSDLGDLGDNVPVTLLKSLSFRRGSLRSLLSFTRGQ